MLALLALGGCAATIGPQKLEQRTAQALGREPGFFTIVNVTEEAGGRIHYTVKTPSGAGYQCYLVSATGFQKAMSFGQTPDSDAICTPMAGSAPAAQTPSPTCNGLLKAAGKC